MAESKNSSEISKDELAKIVKAAKSRLTVTSEQSAKQSLMTLTQLVLSIRKADPNKIAAKVDSYISKQQAAKKQPEGGGRN